MKKFWKWKNQTVTNQETQEQTLERTLFLNGTIAEESWFDDDITPKLFRDELFAGNGDITIWINSPGGDCVAAAQIYNMMMEYPGNVTVKIDGIAASAVTNSLMDKLAAKCRIKKPETPERSVDSLMERLDLIKQYI